MKTLPIGKQTFAKIIENDNLYVDKSVNTAINQAKKKDYVGEFLDGKRPIKIVGINFLEDDENEIFSYEINLVK